MPTPNLIFLKICAIIYIENEKGRFHNGSSE